MGMLKDAKETKDAGTAGEHSTAKEHKKQKHKASVPKNASEAAAGESVGEPDDGPADDSDQDASDQTPPQGGADEQEGMEASAAPDSSGDQQSDEEQGGAEDDGQDQSDPGDDGQSQEEGNAQGGSPAQEDDSDDSDDSAAPPSGQAQPSGPGPSNPNAVDLSKVQASPALIEEYKRCNAALYTALYTNDKVANAILSGIQPQGPHKVESVVRASTLLFTQINKQLKFVKETPQVVLPFMRDIVVHVLDLATQVKKIPFSTPESEAAVSSSLEIIMRVIGVNKKQMQSLRHIIPRSQLQDGMTKYQQHLQMIKGVRGPLDKGGAAGGAPGGAAPPAGGPPPQGGAPGGAPSPQPGAPDTAAPGPGQSAPPGGMLSQAANQPPPSGGQ